MTALKSDSNEPIGKFYDADIMTAFEPLHYDKEITITFGARREAKNWNPKTIKVSDFLRGLCTHTEGQKDGLSFVLGDMVPGQRLKQSVKAHYGVGLDIDTGTPSATVDAALAKLGCLAVRYSTHSAFKTKTDFKKDKVVKFAGEREIDEALVKAFLIEVEKWDSSIVDTVEHLGTDHTEKGIVVNVSHAPMPKHRVVVIFDQPFVMADAAAMQTEAMKMWAKVPEALASLLGVPFDTSCTDPSRLFYFPRHTKGKPFEVSIFGGPYFDWRTLELDNALERLVENLGKGKSKSVTDEGRALGRWSLKCAHGFQIADVIEAHTPDRIRHNTGHGLEIECPFDEDHSNAGDHEDRACLAVNAGEGPSEWFTLSCRHETCRNKTNLDMLGKAIKDGWFDNSVLESEDYNAILEEDQKPNALTTVLTPELVVSEVADFGRKPDVTKVQGLLDRIAAVSDDKQRVIMFASAIQELKGQDLKRLASRARTEADKSWEARRVEDMPAVTRRFWDIDGQEIQPPGVVDCDPKSGAIIRTFENCLKLLELAHGQAWGFSYDEMGETPLLRGQELPWAAKLGREIGDDVLRVIRHFLIEQWGVTFKKDDVYEAAMTLASYTRFNPLLDYLGRLEWDRTPRIDTWLRDYLGVEQSGEIEPYVREVGRLWLVAAVRRAKRPGVKFDNMLIFEGMGEAGKSTTLAILGGDYFTDAPLSNVDDKDSALQLRGRWIMEMPELSVLSKATTESMLAFVSRTADRYRSPYDRSTRTYPRRCVFAGTTNKSLYLTRTSGNRRYWPVKVADRINLDGLADVRDQLWAEAVALEATGMSIFLPDNIRDLARAEQAKRVPDHPWTEFLQNHLDTLTKMDRISTGDLLDVIGIKLEDRQPRHVTDLHAAMAAVPVWTYKKAIRFKLRRNAAGEELEQVTAGYQRPATVTALPNI